MTQTTSSIAVLVAQFPITLDVRGNLESMLAILAETKPNTLVVFPEGSLSGYAEDPAFLHTIDKQRLADSLRQLQEFVIRQGLHIVFGSCLPEDGRWYNAGIYYGPLRERFIYRKVNLATNERTAFAAGSCLSVVDLRINGRDVKLGIQLYREIRFPEQWQYLARAGAEVFAYLTNAVGDATQAPIWRSHLISRAAENQRYVLCANNAAVAQKCPSMIVTPSGEVPWEVTSPLREAGHYTIDVTQISNWYLNQSRRDLVMG